MKIEIAKTAGFCFGVRRAVDTVRDQCGKGNRVFTYGPVVHNEIVVNELKGLGAEVISDEEGLSVLKPGDRVVIRAHGVPEKLIRNIRATGAEVVDATCPFVSRIHEIVMEESGAGREVLVAGRKEHPEVTGIVGWCPGRCTVIADREEALEYMALNPENKSFPRTIVAQTTYNYEKFQDLVELFEKRGYNVKAVNTICGATRERQTEAGSLAERVQAMIVIGGRNSSNSARLYEICRDRCERTFFINSASELDPAALRGAEHIGITAGASTPKQIIEEVTGNVRRTDI
ncbi:MAG: 4-hydroxy-3-methylbut-2-enyl diphosphate reductase [Lachnospiraceae bacterium]|nr:4-hydroxy-3-methylbut-2-enyl diphosphate reductase [Lachnospiraceae bacterium]